MAIGKVLFLYNAVIDTGLRGYVPQLMSYAQIEGFNSALTKTGHQIIHLNLRSPEQLKDLIRSQESISIAFCIAEGFLDLPMSIAEGSGAARVRRVLADAGLQVSHSPATAMETCWHKDRTHQALRLYDIPTPDYCVIQPESDSLEQQLRLTVDKLSFPLFVKPAAGGTSVGISDRSLVSSPDELAVQVQALRWEFKNLPILVEEYLPGREYTVGVIGNSDKLVLPIIAFPPGQKIRTLKVKRKRAQYSQEKIGAGDSRYKILSELAANVFDAVGAQDVLRIDFREDAAGNPMVIDVNGNPALVPTASLAQMAQWAGLTYDQFIGLLLNISLARVYGEIDGKEIA